MSLNVAVIYLRGKHSRHRNVMLKLYIFSGFTSKNLKLIIICCKGYMCI